MTVGQAMVLIMGILFCILAILCIVIDWDNAVDVTPGKTRNLESHPYSYLAIFLVIIVFSLVVFYEPIETFIKKRFKKED